jgi:hypothetical protein
MTIIDRDTKWKWLKVVRRNRALAYYDAVDLAGVDSFMEGKMIG